METRLRSRDAAAPRFGTRPEPVRTPSTRRVEVALDDRPSTGLEPGLPRAKRLRAYLAALWRVTPVLRAGACNDAERPRRARFDRGLVTLPPALGGVADDHATAAVRAALAHIGAHLAFGGPRFPVGRLRPLQVALVSLIEDARVEQLAMRALPGLRRVWAPFHMAEPGGVATAPALLARLARALFDLGFDDPDGWVRKGRAMFLAEEARWGDPAISRRIGGLLGNDLGQMRVQFNAKAYVVEPLYRDDNHGLWDYAEAPEASEVETVLAGVRFEARDRDEPPRRERQSPDADLAEQASRARRVSVDAQSGIPIARYPEWDFAIGRERPDWVTLVDYAPIEGADAAMDAILDREHVLVRRIETLIGGAKVSRPVRLRRQAQGDQLDLDAAIDAVIDRRLGRTPDPRVYARMERRFRDLAVLVLLDVSHSTNDVIPRIRRSVLDLEREAALLLAHAMAGLGDPFAMRAFCSDGRSDVRYYRIKDFDAPFDAGTKRRLAGLSARYSTRIGAALRHAGHELMQRPAYRHLLLVISDGEPSDTDVGDRRYLVEDARRAVLSLSHRGVDVFCVGLDAGGDNYLARIFGRQNVLQIDRIEKLPERLSLLYFRLTS
jgi:nitric oxide reductase NorD protein